VSCDNNLSADYRLLTMEICEISYFFSLQFIAVCFVVFVNGLRSKPATKIFVKGQTIVGNHNIMSTGCTRLLFVTYGIRPSITIFNSSKTMKRPNTLVTMLYGVILKLSCMDTAAAARHTVHKYCMMKNSSLFLQDLIKHARKSSCDVFKPYFNAR
jgi:hypothetical protein